MQQDIPLTRDLVLVGGGHSHALVLRRWGMNPLPGVRLTLINPGPTAPYSGMLPGHIAGHYPQWALELDLVRLARFAGARLIMAPATGLDPVDRTVRVAGCGDIAYDVASLDVGISAQMPDIPGFSDHAVGAKPLDVYAARWRGFLRQVTDGQYPPQVAVIGGGVAGVELALAMQHALSQIGAEPEVRVIEAGPQITGLGPAARRRVEQTLARAGVGVETEARIDRITADAVWLENGRQIPAALTIGAAGAFAHRWLEGLGLPLTDGFVDVADSLQVPGFPDLFAVGDCANLTASPRPKAGVFAVRAAPVLFDNLRASLSGGPMRRFRPQRRYLKLISLGGKVALAEKFGLAVAHGSLWRWKDRIDTKFIDKLNDLPVMEPQPAPKPSALGVAEAMAGKPLCGGCGAKLGSDALRDSLDSLAAPTRPDILIGPGDDAAILSVGDARQVVTNDHLRAFTADHALLARIAAVHAMGDIWAMGAQPQAALTSVILPRMSPQLQARTLSEITRAAAQAFQQSGAAIVGGHSTMGSELTIGFAVTGLCDNAPITHAGAKAGDALILTRPIGSGVLLAGEMAGVADGRDVAAALQQMSLPQDLAASILSGAHAMTDVTGFGLAGHLMAICRASGVGAGINLEAVPLYSGALALAEAGQQSSLFDANRAAAPVAGAEGSQADLLFDPQTAGGLLAAVDPDHAKGLLADLRDAGITAVQIGRIMPGPPGLCLL